MRITTNDIATTGTQIVLGAPTGGDAIIFDPRVVIWPASESMS